MSLLLALPALVSGQHGLNARKAQDYVSLSLVQNELFYEVDSVEGLRRAKAMPDTLILGLTSGPSLNLLFEFLNPLKYSITTKTTLRDDPAYEAAGDFFAAVGGLLKTLEVGVEESKPAADAAAAAIRSFRVAAGGGTDAPNIYAPDLLEWILWYGTSPPLSLCLSDNTQALGFISLLADIDDAYYGAGSEPDEAPKRGSTRFRDLLTNAVKTLADPETMTALANADAAVRATLVTLGTLETAAGKRRNELTLLLPRLSWRSAGNCQSFQRYTEAVVTRFLTSVTVLARDHGEVIEELQTLVDGVSGFLRRDAGDERVKVTDVRLPGGKVAEVGIVVKRRSVELDGLELEVSDESEVSGHIRVREHLALAPEFSMGFAFTSLDAPSFGTTENDGETVLADAGGTSTRVFGVAMLNLVLNTWDSGLVYPTLQLGVGSDTKRPALFAGGGLRFVRAVDLSVTGGVMVAWVNELQTLSIGDPVSGTAEIEKDIGKAPVARAYLGIQYTP